MYRTNQQFFTETHRIIFRLPGFFAADRLGNYPLSAAALRTLQTDFLFFPPSAALLHILHRNLRFFFGFPWIIPNFPVPR
jgi:hypothetical protein